MTDFALRRHLEGLEADAKAYRMLAGKVYEWFNPPDDDIAEEAILLDAIQRAGEYIESLPCTCGDGAAEFAVDPCDRCQALGRAANQSIDR